MTRITDAILKAGSLDLALPKLDLRYRGLPGYCPEHLMPQYTPEHFANRLPDNIEVWTREEVISYLRESYHPDSTKDLENREKLW